MCVCVWIKQDTPKPAVIYEKQALTFLFRYFLCEVGKAYVPLCLQLEKAQTYCTRSCFLSQADRKRRKTTVLSAMGAREKVTIA